MRDRETKRRVWEGKHEKGGRGRDSAGERAKRETEGEQGKSSSASRWGWGALERERRDG